mmetsp:Transcript_22296/g.36909  ORF Transcript_22296/g.36909 Transcript_22296/m.36909 type:complete len:123 (+) Transcript_22296:85-453(+)
MPLQPSLLMPSGVPLAVPSTEGEEGLEHEAQQRALEVLMLLALPLAAVILVGGCALRCRRRLSTNHAEDRYRLREMNYNDGVAMSCRSSKFTSTCCSSEHAQFSEKVERSAANPMMPAVQRC